MRRTRWVSRGSGLLACLVAIGCDGRVSPVGADGSAPIFDGASAGGPVLLDGVRSLPPSPRLVRTDCGMNPGEWRYTYDNAGRMIGWEYPTYDGSGQQIIRYETFVYADGRLSELQHSGGGNVLVHYEGERFVGTTQTGTASGSGVPPTIDSMLSFRDGRFDALRVAFQVGDAQGSLRAVASYGLDGRLERVTYDTTDSPYDQAIEHEFLYNGATGRIDRVIGTLPTSDPPSTAFHLDVEYDSAGRVARVRSSEDGALRKISVFSYNSEGFIGRIETTYPPETEPHVCDMFYESGTTPTVQFSVSNLVTLRGELTPFVNLSEFNLPAFGPDLTTAPSSSEIW
jgi:hypothetical protein